MSLTPTTPRVPRPPTVDPWRDLPPRRVRHQARDVVAVMAFSASSSVAVAAGLLLLAQLGR